MLCLSLVMIIVGTRFAATRSTSGGPQRFVHFGRTEAVRARRRAVLDAAYAERPGRFRRPPSAPRLPEAAWINRPEEASPATASF